MKTKRQNPSVASTGTPDQGLFKLLFDNSDEAILLTIPDGSIIAANPAACKIFGKSEKEICLSGRAGIVDMTDPRLVTAIEERKRTGTFRGELNFVRNDGTLFPGEVTSNVFKDSSGHERTTMIIRDLTEQKRAEQALRESEERYRNLLDVAPVGIAVHCEGKIVFTNNAGAKLLGASSAQELIGIPITEIIHPDGLAKAHERIRRIMVGEQGLYPAEDRYIRLDGTVIDVEVMASPLTYEGKPAVQVIVTDITERKQTESLLLENEKRYRAIVENVNQAYYEADSRGMFTYCNPGLLILAGYSEQELLRMSSFRLVAAEHREYVKKKYKQWRDEQRTDMTLEFLVQPKNKEKFWVEQHTHFQFDEQRHFITATNFLRDIDERKQSEQLLLQYNDRLERAEEHAGLGSWQYTPHTDQRWWSKSLYHLLNFEPSIEAPDFETFMDHVHPDDRAIVREAQVKMFQGLEIPQHEFRTNPKYGPVRIHSAAVYADKTTEKNPVKYHGTVLEVTELRKAERQILKLNRVYAVLSNINQTIVRVHDRQTLFNEICKIAIEDGKFAMAWIGMLDEKTNDVIIAASSGTEESFLRSLKINIADDKRNTGLTGRAIKTGDHAISMDIEHDALMHPWRDALLGFGCRSSASFPFKAAGKTAGTLTLYSSETNFFDSDEIKLLDELASDISFALEFLQQEEKRKQAEAFLVHSELFFRAVWDHSASGMRITDKDGIVVSVNDAYCRIVEKNKHEIEGHSLADVYAEQDRERIAAKHRENFLTRNVPTYFEKCLTLWNGKNIWLENSNSFLEIMGRPSLLLGVFTDITNRKLAEESRKNLEKQLQQAQKLESLGTLASGIAHDFNNILGIVIAHSTMLAKMPAIPDIVVKSSEAITKAGMRGAGLVKQMLTFARKTDVNVTTVYLNDIVSEVSKLLSETFPKTVVVSLHLENKLPPISADATQIHQVLLNLCVNARDAMQNKGSLTVTTCVQSGASLRSHNPTAREDEYIELSVRDTGTGMDEETKRRIFEPFFTTKELGKGTGLGLSLVFGIMETHGGFVEVDSAIGKGTTFRCYFPVKNQPEHSSNSNQKQETIEGGTETILLVEDENLLVDFVKQILEGKGYSVLVARDGQEGLMIYEKNRRKIDLIISDMGLPKFGGYELFQKIKAINPKVRLIFASGYIEPGTKEKILAEGAKHFIQKPYELDEVLREVRNALK